MFFLCFIIVLLLTNHNDRLSIRCVNNEKYVDVIQKGMKVHVYKSEIWYLTESNRCSDTPRFIIGEWDTANRNSERKEHEISTKSISYDFRMQCVVLRVDCDIIICEFVTWISLCFSFYYYTFDCLNCVYLCALSVYVRVYFVWSIIDFVGQMVTFRLSWVLFWKFTLYSHRHQFKCKYILKTMLCANPMMWL